MTRKAMRTGLVAFVILLVVAGIVYVFLRGPRESRDWTWVRSVKPFRRDRLNVWEPSLVLLSTHGDALIQPGMLREFVWHTPLYVLNVRSGRCREMPRSGILVYEAAADPQSATALLSGQAAKEPARSGLWVCSAPCWRAEVIPDPSGASVLGMEPSPTGGHVAAWLLSKRDLEKRVDWEIAQRLGKRSRPPTAHRNLCVIDLHARRAQVLSATGCPLCWDGSGKHVYIRGNGVLLFDLRRARARKVNARTDVLWAHYSRRYRRYVALVESRGGVDVELVDDAFESVRSVAHMPAAASAPCISPDGSKLAYRRSGQPRFLDLESGSEQLICPVAGDMGPLWITDSEILFGRTTGEFFLVGLDGGLRGRYRIHGLAAPRL